MGPSRPPVVEVRAKRASKRSAALRRLGLDHGGGVPAPGYVVSRLVAGAPRTSTTGSANSQGTVVEVRAKRASKPPQPALGLDHGGGVPAPGYVVSRLVAGAPRTSTTGSANSQGTVVEVRAKRASKPPQPALGLDHGGGVPAPGYVVSRLVAGAPRTSTTGSTGTQPKLSAGSCTRSSNCWSVKTRSAAFWTGRYSKALTMEPSSRTKYVPNHCSPETVNVCR